MEFRNITSVPPCTFQHLRTIFYNEYVPTARLSSFPERTVLSGSALPTPFAHRASQLTLTSTFSLLLFPGVSATCTISDPKSVVESRMQWFASLSFSLSNTRDRKNPVVQLYRCDRCKKGSAHPGISKEQRAEFRRSRKVERTKGWPKYNCM